MKIPLLNKFKKKPKFETTGFDRQDPEYLYVAFIDILGFSNYVNSDYPSARRDYNLLVDHMGMMNSSQILNVSIRMISDSMYLVSNDPSSLIETAHWAQQGALWCCNWLVRGAIASGYHQEMNKDDNLFLVSEALVRAAQLEKKIGNPCVVLHPSALPSELKYHEGISNFERSILFYENQWIINPFSVMWGTSAASRAEELKRKFPEHSEKYDWFLGLYQAVKSNEILLPDYIKKQTDDSIDKKFP